MTISGLAGDTEPTPHTSRPRILIVAWTSGYPASGTAETVRLRSFASGLSAAGADVSVHVTATVAPGVGSPSSSPPEGEWRGIPFAYMHGTPGAVPGWLRRRWLELLGSWRMCGAVLAAARSSRHTAVILFSPNLRVILPLRIACSFARVPLIGERDEFPFVYESPSGFLSRPLRSLYNATVFRLFDGTIVISTLLEDFVRARSRRGSWIVRVPILVDVETFGCTAAPTGRRVGYAGNLSHAEELHGLVVAVAAVARAHDDVRALIIGGGSPAEVSSLMREMALQGAEERIELAGLMPPDEVPAALCSCAVLALPRARGVFSSAGFPTKLGEYLATGRPVVVTRTGDIPLYLRPGIDAFVVPPDDPAAFADALERALYDPASVSIGRAGRSVARARFDPVRHMALVLEALELSWARTAPRP